MHIVRDTCPAPTCNLTPHDVHDLRDQLGTYQAHFVPAFARHDQAYWADVYLRGLLSGCARKSVEPMAWHLGIPICPLQVSLAHRMVPFFVPVGQWKAGGVLLRCGRPRRRPTHFMALRRFSRWRAAIRRRKPPIIRSRRCGSKTAFVGHVQFGALHLPSAAPENQCGRCWRRGLAFHTRRPYYRSGRHVLALRSVSSVDPVSPKRGLPHISSSRFLVQHPGAVALRNTPGISTAITDSAGEPHFDYHILACG